jgi:hypothetical protein
MILIINSPYLPTNNFKGYLIKKKVPYLEITLNQLIDEIEIIEEDNCKYTTSIWKLGNKIIDFNKITGIFCQFQHLEDSLFKSYSKQDRGYARSEWQAYLIYKSLQYKNMVNPILHKYVNGHYFRTLPLLSLAKSSGFKIPRMYSASNCKFIENYINGKPFYIKENFYDYNFKIFNHEGSYNPIFAIKYINGAKLFALVIDDHVLGTIIYKEGKEVFDLPEKIKINCITLAKKLGLTVAEIYLHRNTNNQYYFYHASPFPNWDIFAGDEDIIWEKITNILLRQNDQYISNTKDKKNLLKKCFIEKKNRPSNYRNFINLT